MHRPPPSFGAPQYGHAPPSFRVSQGTITDPLDWTSSCLCETSSLRLSCFSAATIASLFSLLHDLLSSFDIPLPAASPSHGRSSARHGDGDGYGYESSRHDAASRGSFDGWPPELQTAHGKTPCLLACLLRLLLRRPPHREDRLQALSLAHPPQRRPLLRNPCLRRIWL